MRVPLVMRLFCILTSQCQDPVVTLCYSSERCHHPWKLGKGHVNCFALFLTGACESLSITK